MQSYRLRHRVTFQHPVLTQDPQTGAETTTWETVYLDSETPLENVPAEVLTGPGREYRQSQTTQAETSARINLRWFPVDRIEICTWRVLWDGRIYNIHGAETDATARREWRLTCTDGVNDGA
ncbi:head-tail adaptor protein [Microbulbifer thermotolerans]|uniref:head-tail adaptor protein n=1 Tax=Microbulbifer thermotolerans TaxID=252514 RepID=UPI00267189B1|nr:head-tail adaptor protein [Microbulbifer thermotolerans]WKT59110.1 head-tail adaptor protein [Microbulbifer thermotolerans]